jgi:hypothetical protein
MHSSIYRYGLRSPAPDPGGQMGYRASPPIAWLPFLPFVNPRLLPFLPAVSDCKLVGGALRAPIEKAPGFFRYLSNLTG